MFLFDFFSRVARGCGWELVRAVLTLTVQQAPGQARKQCHSRRDLECCHHTTRISTGGAGAYWHRITSKTMSSSWAFYVAVASGLSRLWPPSSTPGGAEHGAELHDLVTGLKTEVADYGITDGVERSAAKRNKASFLHKIDANWLVRDIFVGKLVSLDVQEVLGREGLTVDDFLALPRLSDDTIHRVGIYLNVVELRGGSFPLAPDSASRLCSGRYMLVLAVDNMAYG